MNLKHKIHYYMVYMKYATFEKPKVEVINGKTSRNYIRSYGC